MSFTESTVGQLVVDRPARARVFEKYGIDYCCGGKKPLGQACNEKGIQIQEVVDAIAKSDEHKSESDYDWASASLTQIAANIEATHHAYLREELPRLDFLTQKVANAHGGHDPRLLQLRQIFLAFKAELEEHMMKEERVLFPMCRQLDHATEPLQFHCGSVKNPIRMMMLEHQDAGDAMDQFRALTDDYTPPPTACNTYRALLDALKSLELDMHQHVHKENNIMFPRAAEMEARLG
jgi:regulator of cell morphogenesis and NO signaling